MEKQTLAYKVVDGRPIHMDVYTHNPEAPLILYIHGGALIWGSRGDLPQYHIDTFLDAGFTVCSMDYRLAPETTLSTIAEDVRDVIIYLRHDVQSALGITPTSLTVMGGSAGGYLSLLSGTFEVRPDRIVALYGYGDILSSWYTEPDEHYLTFHKVSESEALACVGSEPLSVGSPNRFNYYLYCRQQGCWVDRVAGDLNMEQIRSYCPILSMDDSYPPTLLIHGDEDKDVPYEESIKMHRALLKRNIPTKLITAKGYGHAFDYIEVDSMVESALKEIIQFIKA